MSAIQKLIEAGRQCCHETWCERGRLAGAAAAELEELTAEMREAVENIRELRERLAERDRRDAELREWLEEEAKLFELNPQVCRTYRGVLERWTAKGGGK